MRSFGHLQVVGTPHASRQAWAMAAPAARLIRGASTGASFGRRSTDTSKEDPGVETQVRPSRPRPASCWFATTTVHSGAPSSAKRRRSELVESVTSRKRTGPSSWAARTASVTSCSVSIGPTSKGGRHRRWRRHRPTGRRYLPMAQPRLLVANRGEIALRVMRTCREMGIPTVAVYSDADREALFVEMADDAYHLGPAAPSESYLNVPRILEVAGRARATLVHPGYGFLAENAGFARAVAEAGLTFVGPTPEAMTLMGDKAAARRTAESVGAPTIPGTPEPITADRASAEVDRIGFPIVVKAAFGGGGKGMHRSSASGTARSSAGIRSSSRRALHRWSTMGCVRGSGRRPWTSPTPPVTSTPERWSSWSRKTGPSISSR